MNEESIQAHWEYVREVIRDGRDEDSWIHLTVRDYLVIIGYHYKTALTHNVKHELQSFEQGKVEEKNETKWWEMLDWNEFPLEHITGLPDEAQEYALNYRSLSEKVSE